jgi:hypothetical protein
VNCLVKIGLLCAALALSACASNTPVSAPPAAPAAAAASTSANPSADTSKVPHGYHLVVKNGTEFYCRYEPVAGSRTLRDEVCLTKDQFANGQGSADDFARDMRQMPVNPSGANPAAH